MNPYLKKLGLESPDPNHFELLRIRHEEVDKDVIKAAAKKALGRIGPEPTDQSHAEWKTVQRQIKHAYHCLVNDQQRAAYLAELGALSGGLSDEDVDDFTIEMPHDEQDTETGLDTVTEELRIEMEETERPLAQAPPVTLTDADVVNVPQTQFRTDAATPNGTSTSSTASTSSSGSASTEQRQPGRSKRTKVLLIVGVLIVVALAVGGFLWLRS